MSSHRNTVTTGNRPHIEGELTRRGESAYERARESAVWNGLKPDRFPELIVRPASERDIPQVLAYAREQGLRVSMRSGGHNWSGAQLRDGALLLDLSGLEQCDIDPDSSTATVGPGVIGRTLAAQLARYRLAFPTGHCPTVALGGYLLSGGLGWNCRELGPACQYVEEIEAVTADGRTVTCSQRENPDLFWAARGAGCGFFAVVTRFRLRLLPHPGSIMTARFTFPLTEAERVGSWAVSTAREMPSNVETSLVLTAAGPAVGTAAPGPRLKIQASAFAATREQAADALVPLDACPFLDRALEVSPSSPVAFRDLYEGDGSTWSAERRYTVDTLWSTESYETQLARGAELIARSPSEHSLVLIPVEPVAPDPQGLRDMAFSALGESYLACFAIWEDPAADVANTRWLREGMDELDPSGTGSHYIGEADLGAGVSRSRRSYAPADWERLRQVRDRWDPSGLFQDYLTP
ncbi:FAD-binding oxidoreductase [Streptomyces bathyalis]|uniref:FAD-binding oxidoreductase n=1 Tax=Streptomyces bathyalis TaxID=2710756 RepID=A0A7T1T6P3_9ACTN|nr:FAD-binding oxidoreductase [Streptomyces bathyalis]QPP07410.1 FAD-binding oxidoreductase [Streptomyces bathyalis]